jgi:drug/metabolite transporter (DMT)-like permease
VKRIPAPLLVAVTVVLWAVAFPAIRVALESFGPVSLSFARIAVAAIVLLAVAPFAGVRLPQRRELWPILLCAATGMAAYQLLLNLGERSVPAGTASLLIASAPVYSLVISSRVLRESIPGRRWAGLAVALAGSVVVALAGGGAAHRLSLSGGALVVIAAAVVQGVYHVAQRPLLRTHSPIEVATYGMVAGMAMLLPAAPLAARDVVGGSARSLLAVAFLGIGPSAIGFVTWAAAVGRLHVSRPALALYVVPVVAIAVAYVWLGEVPSTVALVGGAISLCGVALGTITRRTARPGRPPSERSGSDRPSSRFRRTGHRRTGHQSVTAGPVRPLAGSAGDQIDRCGATAGAEAEVAPVADETAVSGAGAASRDGQPSGSTATTAARSIGP